MSWFSRLSSRWPGRAAAALALALTVAGLPGCGFQPLYGGRDEPNGAVTKEMSEILVMPIADRTGQKMHNMLRDNLNPLGQPAEPQYGLNVTLKETTEDLGIRKDATATRANLTMEANYSLFSYQDKSTLFRGRSTSTNSYDILDSQYATQVAEDDARTRALQQLSEEMKIRLAIYFKSVRR